jgi:hypothetical protein
MSYQLLKSLFITVILTTVFTNCFCQYDPWTSNKTHKDLRLKGRVDSCVTNIITISYKGGIAKKQPSAKIVEYYNKHGETIKMYHYIFWPNRDTADVIKNPFITVYNYDKKGNFEEMAKYNSKGLYAKDVFTYTNGKTAGYLKHYNLPDNKLGSTRIKFNTVGDIEESVEYRDTAYNAKPYSKINYEYNQNGYLVKDSISYSHTSRTHRNFYTYDQNNNLIKILRTADPQPSIEVYTYPKFDKLHNWLEVDMFSEGKLIYVCERQITYYK